MVLYNFLYLPIILSWADELCYGCAARCRIGCFIFLCARVWIVQVLMNNTLYHQAYIEGYTELLGISTYCRLNLTMTRMELLIQGNFLNLIKAELFVFAAYSYLFPSAEFYVRVTVDLSGINNVSNLCSLPQNYLKTYLLTKKIVGLESLSLCLVIPQVIRAAQRICF